MPRTRRSVRRLAADCIEDAQIDPSDGHSKQKRPRRAVLIFLKSLRDFGAGEGIRTLDPNLGKVVIGLSGAIPFHPTTLHATDK
jgi:hypothetical protein